MPYCTLSFAVDNVDDANLLAIYAMVATNKTVDFEPGLDMYTRATDWLIDDFINYLPEARALGLDDETDKRELVRRMRIWAEKISKAAAEVENAKHL